MKVRCLLFGHDDEPYNEDAKRCGRCGDVYADTE